MIDNINTTDDRIKTLLLKIKDGSANSDERKEYIELLYKHNYINTSDYNKYLKDLQKPTSSNSLGEILVGLGLAVLIGALVGDLFKEKK